jgi:hypothetical protein
MGKKKQSGKIFLAESHYFFAESHYVTPGPSWMAHEWPMSAGARV